MTGQKPGVQSPKPAKAIVCIPLILLEIRRRPTRRSTGSRAKMVLPLVGGFMVRFRSAVTAGLVLVVASVASGQDSPQTAFLKQNCVSCHNSRLKDAPGGLALDTANIDTPETNPAIWEK